METVRAENKNLRARLAEYGHTIKAYGNRYTPPSRKTTTQEINAQKEGRKKKTPLTGAADTKGTRAWGRSAGRRWPPPAT
ncbi:MAG: hypothetical protein IS632_09275 [Thaumarchaeota archaeon]|nr:hypothetical protein [Nitrososphaerota archaeon]